MEEPKKIDATILFADIVDSLQLANYLGVDRYEEVLREWYDITKHVIENCERLALSPIMLGDVSIRGDELCVFFRSGSTQADIRAAMTVAVETKVGWLLSETNRQRSDEGKPPLEIGVGIHTGLVVEAHRPEVRANVTVIGPDGQQVKSGKGGSLLLPARAGLEGFPISIAKRIEDCAREGRFSKIIVSHTTHKYLGETGLGVECDYVGKEQLRGVSQHWAVYEVKGCESWHMFQAARDDATVARLETCVNADPDNVWLLGILMQVHRHRNEAKRCMATADRAIRVDDTNAYAHFYRGMALGMLQRPKEALQDFDKALRLGSHHIMVRVYKASALIQLGQLGEAQVECVDVLKMAPYHPSAHYNIACVHARRGDTTKAVYHLDQAAGFGGPHIVKMAQEDDDFAGMTGNPSFANLVARWDTGAQTNAGNESG